MTQTWSGCLKPYKSITRLHLRRCPGMASASSLFASRLLPIPGHVRVAVYGNPTSLRVLLERRPKGDAKARRALFRVAAEGRNGLKQDDDDGGGGVDLRRDRQRPAFNLRWRDLLSPDPENIAAIALTGLLTWASVQVLFQLFVISVAILLAAVKNFLFTPQFSPTSEFHIGSG
ncbi:hypothetical protein MUK42_30327 [Musa troglodytarum]|uniref:Uncharacterized protein n=1 Tax=Musa troglodytarum TaxID=320322 RepID=A0A9E7FMS6_9LILI|nr:hypothetical protein MUK42_30327 [Musa troglodytarum]